MTLAGAGPAQHSPIGARGGNAALIAFICLVAAVKLVLANAMLVQARPDEYLDDMLFLDLGRYFAQGQWLGPFGDRTLAKGPVYPIFIGLNIWTGLPLKLAEQMLYLLSCYFFASSVGQAADRRLLTGLIFAALAFNPAATMAEVAYVLRDGVYPALTLLVFGCSIRLMTALTTAPEGRALLWGGCLGLSLAVTWLTREEGLWLIPAVLVFLLSPLAFRGQTPGKRPWHVAVGLGIGGTVVAFLALLGTIATVNWAAYGVFATNDYRSGAFARAFGALQRIAQEKPIAHVPVPTSSMEKAFEASASFRSIRSAFEQESAFRDASCRVYADHCGEIAGGWMSWALRIAAARADFYRDGPTAQEYWARVAAEINSACDSGQIRCEPRWSSLAPPLPRWPLERLPTSFLQGMATLVTMRDVSPQPRPSYGDPTQIKLIESVVNQATTPSKAGLAVFMVQGWMLPRAGLGAEFALVGNDNKVTPVPPQWFPSPDLAATYGGSGGAQEARFLLRGSCLAPCRLRIEQEGLVRHEVPLTPQTRPRIIETNSSGTLAFDRVVSSLEAGGTGAAARALKIRILERIAHGYSLALPFLASVAIAGFILVLALGRKDPATRIFLTLLTALVAAVVTRLAMLTIVHETSFPALYCLYLAPAYPLVIAFVCVALWCAGEQLRTRLAKNRG